MTRFHRGVAPIAHRALVMAAWTLGCAHVAAQEDSAGRNRDPFGPANVDTYIASLLSPTRVAELKPEEVITALRLPPNAAVADLGSGPGVFTLPLARHLTRGVVYAVDIEPRQLDSLRARLLEEGLANVVPVLASASTPHLPPAHIDLILVVDTYRHLRDPIDYFRRLRTVLTPGGRLAILERRNGEAGQPREAAEVAQRRIHEELQAAGWSQLQRFDFLQYHDFAVWVPSESF
jgi:ubiquinone/menaquinone biosynthesis C-methylase UbiE